MALEEYLVLDLQDYRFVESKRKAYGNNGELIEIDNKTFLIDRNGFKDYKMINKVAQK